MRLGSSLLFAALLASPAMADEQMVPTAAAPAEPIYEASRPAQVLPKDKAETAVTGQKAARGSQLPRQEGGVLR